MTLCLKSLRVGAISAVIVGLWIGAANGQKRQSQILHGRHGALRTYRVSGSSAPSHPSNGLRT